MAGENILYVCCDVSHLLSRELPLLEMGYEVKTVLGADGVMAQTQFADYACVIIDNEGQVEERSRAVSWLKNHHPAIPVIALCAADEALPQADYQSPIEVPSAYLNLLSKIIKTQSGSH